jgi:hypothetical protein
MPDLGTDRFGHRVFYDPHHWQGHVLLRHPEVTGLEEELQQAIATPTWIVESGSRQAGHWEPLLVFFRVLDDSVLKVVVRPYSADKAFAVTAYLVAADSHKDSHTAPTDAPA